MRFNLILSTESAKPWLPEHYQYSMSDAISHILKNADNNLFQYFQQFKYLANNELDHFKGFTFSDLQSPFRKQKSKLIPESPFIQIKIAFQLPDASSSYVKNLFINQRLEIADSKNKIYFTIQQVQQETLLPAAIREQKDPKTLLLLPLSPMVIGKKKFQQINYEFLTPIHSEFVYWLLHHWKEKYRAFYPEEHVENVFHEIEIKVLTQKIRTRPILLKTQTSKAFTIKGYDHFKLHARAPVKALELLLNTGAGLYNELGMGFVVASA